MRGVGNRGDTTCKVVQEVINLILLCTAVRVAQFESICIHYPTELLVEPHILQTYTVLFSLKYRQQKPLRFRGFSF